MTSALHQVGFGSSLVLRFPDPEYEPFKQVAILASRPVSSNNYAYRNIDLAVAGVIGQCNRTHSHIIRTYDTTPSLTRVLRAEAGPSVFEAEQPAALLDLLGDVRQGLAALLGEEDFVSRLQEATIANEHYESEMSIDDLPPLVSFAPESLSRACRGMDVQVKVQTNGHARMRAMVPLEDVRQFRQLSLFG